MYDSKIISDEEFLTFYESYGSKNPEFLYSSYLKFDFDQMDESECLAAGLFESRLKLTQD